MKFFFEILYIKHSFQRGFLMKVKSLLPVLSFSKTHHYKWAVNKDFDTQLPPQPYVKVINHEYVNSHLEQNPFGYEYFFILIRSHNHSQSFLFIILLWLTCPNYLITQKT